MAFFHKQNAHEARHLLDLQKRGSASHIDISKKPGSLSHIDLSAKGNSLSHIDLSKKPAGSQSHVNLDNKNRFIHNAGKKVDTDDVVTVVSAVYVTEAKTFTGPAVYVTQSGNDATPTIAAAANTNTRNSPDSAATAASSGNSYESAKSRAHQAKTRTSSASSSPAAPSTTRAVGSPLRASAPTNTAGGTPLSVSTSNAGVLNHQHSGMSSGAKAGLALGILAIIGIVAGLALFCIRRRKQQTAERGEKLDEKHASQNSFFSGTAAAVGAPAGDRRASMKSVGSGTSRTGATAPRLSLRAVPSLFANGAAMSEKAGQNPFSDAAVVGAAAASNPFEDGARTRGHSATASWEGSGAGTPQLATAAAVPVGAGPRGPNNVHRVQLDFKPTMDDELELKSGQLVRMLHEYDDGWALCIRMDRTQQGVCPRTCLSKLAVKPRPPPQNGAQGRPMGPPPPGMRGPPPPSGNKMMPRPLTPTGRERANTAGSRTPSPETTEDVNRSRSQSVSSAERPVSPIETGVPARKPVPGQAM